MIDRNGLGMSGYTKLQYTLVTNFGLRVFMCKKITYVLVSSTDKTTLPGPCVQCVNTYNFLVRLIVINREHIFQILLLLSITVHISDFNIELNPLK